jgi:hypothetical protein
VGEGKMKAVTVVDTVHGWDDEGSCVSRVAAEDGGNTAVVCIRFMCRISL